LSRYCPPGFLGENDSSTTGYHVVLLYSMYDCVYSLKLTRFWRDLLPYDWFSDRYDFAGGRWWICCDIIYTATISHIAASKERCPISSCQYCPQRRLSILSHLFSLCPYVVVLPSLLIVRRLIAVLCLLFHLKYFNIQFYLDANVETSLIFLTPLFLMILTSG